MLFTLVRVYEYARDRNKWWADAVEVELDLFLKLMMVEQILVFY